ncbi:hypothetical protein Fot_10598 [Forsythia ovata]|uniref:Uncharacterized protein n=1 Tax=Forsythia ovata TaxID=205694 RepID=A0ABD1WJY0_9LAMI
MPPPPIHFSSIAHIPTTYPPPPLPPFPTPTPSPPYPIRNLNPNRRPKTNPHFPHISAIRHPHPPSLASHSSQTISFQELYKRNVLSKTEESGSTSSDSTAKPVGVAAASGVLPLEAIRQSLSQLRPTAPNKQTNEGNLFYFTFMILRKLEIETCGLTCAGTPDDD